MSDEFEYYCLDCGMLLSGTDYAYHSADHTVEKRRTVKSLEDELKFLKLKLKDITNWYIDNMNLDEPFWYKLEEIIERKSEGLKK